MNEKTGSGFCSRPFYVHKKFTPFENADFWHCDAEKRHFKVRDKRTRYYVRINARRKSSLLIFFQLGGGYSGPAARGVKFVPQKGGEADGRRKETFGKAGKVLRRIHS